MSWYVDRESALDHMFAHAFPLLRRDGFEGAPLFERLPDGRLCGNAIVGMVLDGTERAVLVPFTLLGDPDLVEFATQPGRGYHERQRLYLKAAAKNFVDTGNGPSGLPGSERIEGNPDASVALFFANVLGANAHRPPGDWIEYGRYAAGRPPRLLGMHEATTVIRISEIADAETRRQATHEASVASQWFTRAFAFFRGSIVDASREPRWIVAADHDGKAVVRIDTDMHGGDNPADKAQSAFSLDREREALAYAQAMSETVEGGVVKVKPGAEVFRPDLATPFGPQDTIVRQTVRLGKLVEQVARHVPAGAFKPVAEVAAYCGKGMPGKFDVAEWERLWRRASDALGDTSAFASRTASLADRKAGVRFHQTVLTLRNVCAPRIETHLEVTTERKTPADPVRSPVDLEVTGPAVAGMAELLAAGGDAFLETWIAARDAMDAFRDWPDQVRAEAMVDTLRKLAEAVPDEFPSAPAAGRWAMKGRAVLRMELEGIEADPGDEPAARLP